MSRTGSQWSLAGLAVIALVVGSAVTSCDPSPPPPPPTFTTSTTSSPSCRGIGSTTTKTVRYANVTGVDPNLLSLDYYLPKRAIGCGPAPLVAYVHGGGFRNGDKANKVADKVKLFESDWDSRRLHTFARMESWQGVHGGVGRRSIRRSCASARCGWCSRFASRPASRTV